MNPSDSRSGTETPPSAGALFLAAREELGLSIEEVARQLNLNVTIIRALEQNAYADLPGVIFVKGYLRAYANLLKLDYQEILVCARFEPEEKNQFPASKTSAKISSAKYRAGLRRLGGAVLRVGLVGVLGGLLWLAVARLPELELHKVLERFHISTPASRGGDNESGGWINIIPSREDDSAQ